MAACLFMKRVMNVRLLSMAKGDGKKDTGSDFQNPFDGIAWEMAKPMNVEIIEIFVTATTLEVDRSSSYRIRIKEAIA